jgi:heat shock protein HtpX
MSYGAQPLQEADAPELFRTVRNLTTKAGMPMPRLYLIDSEAPNAFATGRSPQHAVVAVTRGILGLLDRDEMEGVLSHELSHVRNRDMLISTMAAGLASVITWMAHMAGWAAIFGGGRDEDRRDNLVTVLLMMILAPLAAMLIQMAISRSREYQADRSGGQLTGKPQNLARALRKISSGIARTEPLEGARPETAHLMIANPLTASGLASLFSTHPPMEKRIEALEGLEREIRQGLV